MSRARELGAQVFQKATVTELRLTSAWSIRAGDENFAARTLVAADGRNSTVARLRNLLPRVGKERVALQTHIPLPRDFGEHVVLQFRPEGYSGQAPTGNNELNLVWLVNQIPFRIEAWAEKEFGMSTITWRTITPLPRRALAATRTVVPRRRCRSVVEPFTGEGNFYALRSGELARKQLRNHWRRQGRSATPRIRTGAALDVCRPVMANRLARAAVLSPGFA